jgi:hypothetical protein
MSIDNLKSPQEARMSAEDFAQATWWAWLWGEIEHWAFLAVVVALAVEFAALKFGEPYKEKLDHERGLQLAAAQKDAADSKIELEKLKAPRTLLPEQQARIVVKVETFAGLQFDLAVLREKEPLNLMEKIEAVLLAAKWSEVVWTGGDVLRAGKPNVGTAIEVGVSIQFDAKQGSTLQKGANTLAEALTVEGIDARAEFTNTNMPSKNNTAIHVIVGKKP